MHSHELGSQYDVTLSEPQLSDHKVTYNNSTHSPGPDGGFETITMETIPGPCLLGPVLCPGCQNLSLSTNHVGALPEMGLWGKAFVLKLWRSTLMSPV